MIDPDLGFHFRIGEHILTTKTIPQKDLFSFSLPDYPYVYHSWLTDVLLFLVYSRLGLWGISFFYSGLAAITLWLVLKTVQQRVTGSGVLWLLLVISPLFLSINYLRPQIFSLLGIVILYLVFRQNLKKETSLIYLFPFLFLIWANLHGGFFLGLLFFLALLMTEIASFVAFRILPFKLYGYPERFLSLKQNFKLWLVFGLSAAAALVNPYGRRVYEQALRMGTNRFSAQFNIDWAPLVNAYSPSWLFAILLFGSICLLLMIRSRVELREKIMIVLFFTLSLKLNRFSMPLVVVLLPALLFFLTEKTRLLKKIAKPLKYILSVALVFVFLAFLAYSYEFFLKAPIVYTDEAAYVQEMPAPYTYPYGAVKYIQENPVPKRLLNDFNWGGYLIWKLPERKVFIDGRMDNFFVEGESFAKDHWRITNLDEGWNQLLDDYQIEAVLISKGWPLAQALRVLPEWQILYEDDSSILFERIQ